jgi:phage terminase Nu1 subunit (DNA packaging protein)
MRGDKRGTFVLEASVSGYCQHLRDMASARGGEDAVAVRVKLASAQADLAAEKVKAMRGETLPTVGRR